MQGLQGTKDSFGQNQGGTDQTGKHYLFRHLFSNATFSNFCRRYGMWITAINKETDRVSSDKWMNIVCMVDESGVVTMAMALVLSTLSHRSAMHS